ncbi:cell division and transport-associated protein TolR [Plasticicumulans lactativorans]|uniref:Tol-Pal system protein TolR n=1 Tax=Plasticicumulans lactativorans TaxID=1133106 RepID=A0A4R2L5I2_9GAMM|nr:protein TolR [Plasticicumulans lactativorans]TCO81970.1 cell division and transport-associated protein TolR [Plasticicumulans lactativorans]
MARRSSRKKAMADINVVPFIDVMLVLLIIFMATAPLLNQGVEVDLPQGVADVLQPNEQQPLILTVNQHGELFLNQAEDPRAPQPDQAILDRAAAVLALARQRNQPLTVLVKGDKAVDYGRVVYAMGLLKKAGASRVGLSLDLPEG